MPGHGAYREARIREPHKGGSAPRGTLMHPFIAWALAADRIREWHGQAATDRLRRGRPDRAPSAVRRLARLLAVAVADCLRAQRRAAVLQAATDRYLQEPHRPPADYLQFLARTSGPLLHEPPASARARGQAVR